MVMDIKPIETEYDGYRFRSRLEARWAVFFNAAGIRYEYEPEGFHLPDGSMYLPDFYLPDVWPRSIGAPGLWVEVKGRMTERDLNRIKLFSGLFELTENRIEPCGIYDGLPEDKRSRVHPILIVGQIPKGKWMTGLCDAPEWSLQGLDDLYWNFETIDGDGYPEAAFFKDPEGWQTAGRIWVYGWDTLKHIDGFKAGYNFFNPAYEKARKARFEHGEKG